jgi:hypothetical protein
MCVSLDWALDHFPRPTVVKIDVEAAEVEVLEGAQRLLDEVRPIVICEVSPSASSRVSQILHATRYRFCDADNPSNSNPELAPWNTLAIPMECLKKPAANSHEACR